MLLAAIAFVLSGCYIPLRFDAEIEIDRQGYYSLIFDGYVADIELYRGIVSGEIKKPREEEIKAAIKADIERDPNTTEYQYHRRGVFKLGWKREGDLIRSRTVTFLRRNERFFGLAYNKDTGRITIEGRSLSRSQKDQLAQAGLNMSGELRVLTDAKANVVQHNADTVREFTRAGKEMKAYFFTFKNIYRATPAMTITLR